MLFLSYFQTEAFPVWVPARATRYKWLFTPQSEINAYYLPTTFGSGNGNFTSHWFSWLEKTLVLKSSSV